MSATPMDVDAANVDAPDVDGRRPLQHAALAGDTERLSHLLACGVSECLRVREATVSVATCRGLFSGISEPLC